MKTFFKKHWFHVIIGILFIAFGFFRFYQIPERNPFSWDQIDNAWAAKNILYNHQYPLLGMVAKGNTGFYIGPLYYYAIAPFYKLTNYDPIASGIFAGISAVIAFWVIYFVSTRLFGRGVTIIALLIQTVSTEAIHFDRVQWPVDFIPILGILGIYFLKRVLDGQAKHLLTLGLLLGLFFNIHFTAVLFALCIGIAIPFFPRNKSTLIYGVLGILIAVGFLVPNIIAEFMSKNAHTNNMLAYLKNSSHGFHLRRMIQITQDTVSQINIYLPREIRGWLAFTPLVFFIIIQIWRKPGHISPEFIHKLKFVFLVALWYIVPWIVFTIYSGETSDYYYSINRYLSLLLIAYFFWWISARKNILGYLFVVGTVGYYVYLNIYGFFVWPEKSDLPNYRVEVSNRVNDHNYVPYVWGDPKSYLYFYYTYLKDEKSY